MRDPRLAEIEFLMDLERHQSLSIRSSLQEENSGAAVAAGREQKRYGLSPAHFRDMVLHFMMLDFIGGSERRHTGGSLSLTLLDGERSDMMRRLGANNVVDFQPTHAGRVHLWNLRDALLRDPDLEPFGLRSQAAWARDLSVRLQWASTAEPLSIVFIDLDHFGQVNKNLGHPVGDQVLKAAFALIKNLAGTRGYAYRCGGEEVGLLLPGVSLEDAGKLAEEVRATIERDTHKQVEKLTAPQTASIGVAIVAGPMTNDAAVKMADDRMQAAKRAGRNRVIVD